MQDVIDANIRQVKISSPDYADISPEEAAIDFAVCLSSNIKLIDVRNALTGIAKSTRRLQTSCIRTLKTSTLAIASL
jgi:hypothetical protein